MRDIADFGVRTITVSTNHPQYAAILEGWVRWGFLHEDTRLGRVTMAVDLAVKTLVFSFTAPETADLGDPIIDFHDTLMGAARAWQDTYTPDEESEHFDGKAFHLTRNSRCRRESAHYTHADLTVKVGTVNATFPGISVDDLRHLGQFFLDYADKMEDDHRDDLN